MIGQMRTLGAYLMWLGIALFPAGAWWARIACEEAGSPFDSRDYRVWIGFAAFIVVYTTGALLRWRRRPKA